MEPAGEPLEKVINKVFKRFSRDFYDHYMLMAQFLPYVNPKPPTRQLLETWVVKTWDTVLEEIVRKFWTACGYPLGDMLGTTNKITIFPYSPEQDI